MNARSLCARIWAVCGIAAALSFATVSTVHAATVSLNTSASAVSVGDTFELRVSISGLTAAANDSLGGFEFRLLFDAAAVSFVDYDFVDSITGANQLDFAEVAGFGFLGDVSDTGAGALDAFGLSGNSTAVLDSLQAGSFDFLRLRFHADAEVAAAPFTLDTTDSSAPFIDSEIDLLPVTLGTSTLSLAIGGGGTQPVPEPGSIALSLLALAALAGVRRRRLPAKPLALCALGLALAAPVAATAADTKAAAPATPTARAATNPQALGVVTAVVGQRIQVRGADGQLRWYTSARPLPAQLVNKRVQGVPHVRGDAVALDQIRFD